MLGDVVTIYYPGDGVREGSNCATYKGIKDFKRETNGTITFKTKKNGDVTWPGLFRLKKNVELDDADEAEAPAAPAGNMHNHHGY
jgi:hypothetical protein